MIRINPVNVNISDIFYLKKLISKTKGNKSKTLHFATLFHAGWILINISTFSLLRCLALVDIYEENPSRYIVGKRDIF